jgi:hypothetical protein
MRSSISRTDPPDGEDSDRKAPNISAAYPIRTSASERGNGPQGQKVVHFCCRASLSPPLTLEYPHVKYFSCESFHKSTKNVETAKMSDVEKTYVTYNQVSSCATFHSVAVF